MKLLVIFIAVLGGVFLFLCILALVLYIKVRKTMKEMNVSAAQLKSMIDESEINAQSRQKSVTGLTEVLVPKIERDYGDFNTSEFFNKVETSLLAIFNSITNKKISNTKELNLIKDRVEEIIVNNKSGNIIETYKDVKFNKHAIKYYDNKNGSLTITVETSLSYFYEKKVNGKLKEEMKSYPKQTSYITKFVHIYDPDKYVESKTHLSAHCPNCGAILKNFTDKLCDYCGSTYKPINLRSWYISEFKEEKR